MVKSSQWVLAGILLATVAGVEGQESGGFRDLTSWRGPEQVNFRWRHDLGRWGWNPAPWIHLDGRELWVVDPFCEPGVTCRTVPIPQ